MNKTINLIGKVVMFLIIALCVVFYILCSMDSNPSADGSWVGTTISWAIGVLCLGILLVICAEALSAFSDTKSLIRAVIAIVGFCIVAVIFWNIADGTPMQMIGYEGDENTYTWLKIADTGIFFGYLALVGAILSIAVSEIIALFR